MRAASLIKASLSHPSRPSLALESSLLLPERAQHIFPTACNNSLSQSVIHIPEVDIPSQGVCVVYARIERSTTPATLSPV